MSATGVKPAVATGPATTAQEPGPPGSPAGQHGLALAVAAALGAAAIALALAAESGGKVPGALPEVTRVFAAAGLLFGLCGYAPTRLLCPAALRDRWPLLVLPTGAMVSGLVLSVLGFAAVPFRASLSVTLAAAALAALACHLWAPALARARRPAPRDPLLGGPALRLLWPAFIALLVAAITLLPYLRTGEPVVTGTGSDAHLAVGSADLLKRSYPTAINPNAAVDRVPLTWRSKFPIYYSFAAVSSLAGLPTVETLAPLAALLGAFAAVGFFLLATHLLRAPPIGGLLAIALVGLNSMVLLTINNPYFNQTWGLIAMPFMIVLGCLAISEPRRTTVGLAALFWAVGAFAYPLMAAFPAVAVVVYGLLEARRRKREGTPVDWFAPLRRLPRRKLLIPVYAFIGLAFAVPLLGVFEKVVSGALIVFSSKSLQGWAGDVVGLFPNYLFFSVPPPAALGAAGTLLVWALAVWGLLRAPRAAGLAIGLTLALAFVFAALFAAREFGEYFHFKTLAFAGPLTVTCAAAGAAALFGAGARRQRLAGAALGVTLLVLAVFAARDRTLDTHYQVGAHLLELREWDEQLPKDTSVRLDVNRGTQLWAGYFLANHPLSSTRPLAGTAYPHVPYSRKADFILSKTFLPRPHDATKEVVFKNFDYTLWRAKPDIPGRDRSSRSMIQTVTTVGLS